MPIILPTTTTYRDGQKRVGMKLMNNSEWMDADTCLSVENLFLFRLLRTDLAAFSMWISTHVNAHYSSRMLRITYSSRELCVRTYVGLNPPKSYTYGAVERRYMTFLAILVVHKLFDLI